MGCRVSEGEKTVSVDRFLWSCKHLPELDLAGEMTIVNHRAKPGFDTYRYRLCVVCLVGAVQFAAAVRGEPL